MKSRVFLMSASSSTLGHFSGVSGPRIFSMTSVFSNFDYVFWRISEKLQNYNFLWIIWYIWKDKLNNNLDRDLKEVLKIAEK